MNPTYLTPKELAARLRIAVSTLQAMRIRGGGPAYLKTGHRTILYRIDDVLEWEKSRAFNNTAEEKQAAIA